MSLCDEMIAYAIAGEIKKHLPEITADLNRKIKSDGFLALQKIKQILDDEENSDDDCFIKIDEIIKIFYSLGCRTNRHDF